MHSAGNVVVAVVVMVMDQGSLSSCRGDFIADVRGYFLAGASLDVRRRRCRQY